MVGPMSNYASPPQLVESVPFANLEEMHAFARKQITATLKRRTVVATSQQVAPDRSICVHQRDLKRPDQFCSVDQGIYGHLTLRNLAVLAEERGDRAEARRFWRTVLDACPDDAESVARGEATWRIEELPANRRRPDALSFSQEGFKRHRQSRSDDETAMGGATGAGKGT